MPEALEWKTRKINLTKEVKILKMLVINIESNKMV